MLRCGRAAIPAVLALVCAELLATTPPALADPVFSPVESPAAAGHRYTGGWEHFVGGGISGFDCNGDGLPELYAAGGTAPARLLINRSTPGGALHFGHAGHDRLALEGVTGAYPLDIDSDGITDLAILRVGEDLLMRGTGNCGFERFGPDIGFTSPDRWSTAFSATWEAGAVLPAMAFGSYVDRKDAAGPFEACDVNLLYRPVNGRYDAPKELRPGYCALSMLFSDWGRRGRADLRVSNDRHYYVRDGAEQMWAMEPEPRLYSAAEGWRHMSIWGMGIASRDITGDGVPEVFLTSMGDQKLQLLMPDANGPVFADVPFETGITAHRPYTGPDGRPSTGWHAAFGDVDNDGLDDLFVAKGNVEIMPGNAIDDPNNLLVQQSDGSFVERGDVAGLASMVRGRGAVLMDLNRDGLLDLAVNNRNAPLEIYRNETPGAGHWVSIRLHQAAPNTDAVGAWIEVRSGGRVQSREITVGGGHVGGILGPQHFGLGDETYAELRVQWPDESYSPWGC